MASKRALWNKIGRFATAVIVLCFFLPFFGVSCEGVDVITVSGADMVGGCQPGGLAVEATKQDAAKHGGEAERTLEIDNVKREPLAIAALALALISAGLAWVRTRGALKASFVLAIAGFGVIVGLYIKVNGDLHAEVDKRGAATGGSDLAHDMDKDISAGSRFGLWLVAAGLVATAVITGMALREPEPPA